MIDQRVELDVQVRAVAGLDQDRAGPTYPRGRQLARRRAGRPGRTGLSDGQLDLVEVALGRRTGPVRRQLTQRCTAFVADRS